MDDDYLNPQANQNAMDVENAEDYAVQEHAPVEEVHPLALVVNIDQNLQNANIILNNAVYVNFELNPQPDRESPAASATSSRVPSPENFTEESNQSEAPNENPTDAQSSKKRSYSDDEDDGSLCPICLDYWTNTGDHRICALKCGHLFGYKCVNRWLNSQTKKSCPTCKKKVGKSDIRYIYARKLTAVDTADLDNIKRQLDLALEDKNRAQTEVAKHAYKEQQLNSEIRKLNQQISQFIPAGAPHAAHRANAIVRLYMDKSMEACKFGGSRVFDAKCELDLLMASMKSPTNLFTGYGLKKINISGYRTVEFVPMHSLQIRDISFHPEHNWVLTASMDKTFKVIDNNTNGVTYQFHHQMPLWACCWDVNYTNVLYVGTQSGAVIKYDIRNLTEPMATLSVEGDMSPVVSIASIPAGAGSVVPHGGVVSCKLNSLWLFENVASEHRRHSLYLEGPFVSMKYQTSTKQLLVSSRPNSRNTYSRHTLCTLEREAQGGIDCNIVHSFQGGGMQKLLSKSCFLSHDSDYVAAHQENLKRVFLWSINTGDKVCSVPAHETVLDLKGLQTHSGNYLVSLTEKKLEFFKFQ